MRSLVKFYACNDNIEKLIAVTEGGSDISLRMIDWFVTNYAKKRNIIHKRRSADAQQGAPHAAPSHPTASKDDTTRSFAPQTAGAREGPERVTYFSVYLSYREELRTYSKQQFDPFRRNDHIVFRYGEDGALETTVGQLNFFRWAIENGILDYIRDHRAEIDEAMSGKNDRGRGSVSDGVSEAIQPKPCRKGGGAPASPGAFNGRNGSAVNELASNSTRRSPVVLSVRSVISFD
jgi:hypothetical protein